MKPAYFITGVVLLVAILVLVIEFYGYPISGQEFSAQTFTQRNFTYRRSPFTNALRQKRVLTTVDMECDSLVALNLIPPPSKTPQRWDLVSENLQTSSVLSGEFDARFLTSYLNWETDQWNTTNVEKAEFLWPEIAELAREGQYLVIPPIFEWALNQPDEQSNEEFERQLKPLVAQAWYDAASLMETTPESSDSQESHTNKAVRYFEKAATLDPDLRKKIRLEK